MKTSFWAETMSVALAILLSGKAWSQTTERVSVATGGTQANSYGHFPSISADGRFVAFQSHATNLVPGDTNSVNDVFVRDRQSGTTELVSLATGGAQGNDSSQEASISADGRYVAFGSVATNLVPGGTSEDNHVFVRDRQSGTTDLVSVATGGAHGNGYSVGSSISADGRFVAFYGESDNLVPGDTNATSDIFVRDRSNGSTELVSIDTGGVQGDGYSGYPSISADGRYVAFLSHATNLVAGDTNGFVDVFVRDRQNGTTEIVSIATGGARGNSNSASSNASISADGRYVVFQSAASNLVPADGNMSWDVFLRDRQNRTTEIVSVVTGETQGDGESTIAAISADGRFVAFQSLATNLVSGDTNAKADLFIRDRQSGTTVRANVGIGGTQGNGDSPFLYQSISADGRYVAFNCDATNLVLGDTNGTPDVFVRDQGQPPMVSLCEPGTAGVIACPCSNPPSGPFRGCDNFGSASGGATFSALGAASLTDDTLALTATRENATARTVFLQGTSSHATGVAFGAGVRCAGGSLERLYSGVAIGGAITRPAPGDPPVSERSAALGDTIVAGQTRYYTAYYRDPLAAAPCGNDASTFNASQTGSVAWGP